MTPLCVIGGIAKGLLYGLLTLIAICVVAIIFLV